MAREFIAADTEYLDVIASPVTTYPISLACRFWVNNVTANQVIFSLQDKDVAFDRFAIMVRGGDAGDYLWAFRESFQEAATSTSVIANTWNSGVAVFAAVNKVTIYLNGGGANTVTGSESQGAPGTFDSISIGGFGDSTPGDYMDGKVADCGIWNVELTAEDALSYAAGFECRMIRPDGLVFHVPLVRDPDIEIVGGLTLSAGGTPTVAPHPRIIRPTAQILQFPPTPAVGGLSIPVAMRHQYNYPNMNSLLAR